MPNIHFTDDGESQECTTEPCPPHPADSRPPLGMGGEWGPMWHGERLHEHMHNLSGALAAVGYATVNITPAFSDIYDAINALGPWNPPRSNKAERARAKAAKLRQRRAAKAAPRPWGTDWRDTAPMLRKSIASIARDGVPCHAVPCLPVVTARLDMTVGVES